MKPVYTFPRFLSLLGVIFSLPILNITPLLHADDPSPQTYVWVGAGTTAGQVFEDDEWSMLPGRDNLWSNVNNWEVDGSTPGTAPSASDITIIEFSNPEGFALPDGINFAVQMTSGDTAGEIMIGAGFAGGRILRIGEGSSDTITVGRINATDNTSTLALDVPANSNLVMTGGTPSEFTWRVGRQQSHRIDGSVTFTSDYIWIDDSTRTFPRIFGNGDFIFSTPEATVILQNATNMLHSGSYQFRSDQTLSAGNRIILRGEIISLNGGVLDFSDTSITMNHNDSRNTTSDITASEWRTIEMVDGSFFSGISANGTATLRANGDLTVSGTRDFDDVEYAVIVAYNRDSGGQNLNLQGNDLTVTSQGLTLVGAENLGSDSRFIIGGSRVELEDLLVLPNGRLEGNADTELLLRGDFFNESVRNTTFNLAASTVAMIGNGTSENPQFLEAHGIDLGATTDGMTDNFAFGRLEIGTESTPTYVTLVDEVSFNETPSTSDALYLGELFVHADSIFYIGEFHVYVDGTLVEAGSGTYGPGLIVIPEPSLAALTLALTLPGLLLLRRKINP